MAFHYKEEYARYKRYYQSLQPTTPVRRAYTAIIFSFLAVSLFGWYAIRPTIQTILTLKREIVDKTEINKKMENKISMLIEAQAAYQASEPNLPLLNQALPLTSEAPRGVQQIQALAVDSKVAIINISVAGTPLTVETKPGKTPSEAVVIIPVSISVNGTYTDIKKFILGIENLRRIMQINSMLFTPTYTINPVASESATPTGTQIRLDLKLNVFYLPL